MTPPLRPAKCPHCHRDVAWGTLQNGRARSFDAEPKPIADVPPAERFAYSRRFRAVVCLDGEPHPPARVHVPHYCSEYAEARLMRNLARLDDIQLPFSKGAA